MVYPNQFESGDQGRLNDLFYLPIRHQIQAKDRLIEVEGYIHGKDDEVKGMLIWKRVGRERMRRNCEQTEFHEKLMKDKAGVIT